MTLDGYDDDGLRRLHRQAAARADDMHYRAAVIGLRQLALCWDDAAYAELDGQWTVVMAAGDEAREMMGAVTDELERRADERYGHASQPQPE